MGSSNKPAKRDDRPIIKTPKAKSGGGNGNGGGGQKELDLNQTCPVYLDVKISTTPGMQKGSSLRLDERGSVLFGSTEVGKLSARQFQTIVRCEEHGYVYRGHVEAAKDDNLYGRFERATA